MTAYVTCFGTCEPFVYSYEFFAEFFEQQNNAPMSDEQSAYMKDLIEKIEEEQK